jgi:hypothetical protein
MNHVAIIVVIALIAIAQVVAEEKGELPLGRFQ